MSASDGEHPPTDVQPRATQRRFKASYKRQIVEEAAQCGHGGVGAMLRRESLYHSNLAKWRAEYAAGSLSDKPRRPRAKLTAAEVKCSTPNQMRSWDITKLRGRAKWTHFALYTVIDIFSRCIVGWMIAEHKSAELARQLIATVAANQGVQPEQLTLHADNGKPMKAKTLALLLSDLGIDKSPSRPYVSDDNPFSFGGEVCLFIRGTREWANYQFSAPLVPHLCKATGIAARVQGRRRCHALLLRRDHQMQLVKMLNSEIVLLVAQCLRECGCQYDPALTVKGYHLIAGVNNQPVFNINDHVQPLLSSAIALVCEECCVGCEQITIQPAG